MQRLPDVIDDPIAWRWRLARD